MRVFQTKHEEFWAGEFGTEYVSRNADAGMLASKTALFSKVLARAPGIESVLELGANIGLNLLAIRRLLPNVSLTGVELNETAAAALAQVPGVKVHCQSLLEFSSDDKYDLTLTKGVLIHIDPDRLETAYEKLYRHSKRYICVVEYYNPTPVTVPYRGHVDRLFKRDFAGEMMARYADLRLIDYGFVYKNDPVFPLDDITWFLMERR